MTEDPIKLFSTRAERYPEPTESDIAQGTARAALAAIPLVGGSITEVLSMVLAPAVTRRRDEWLKELAEALDDLEAKVDGFKVENLAENEAFVSATIQASRIALATHAQEKRQALRNALLNVALKHGPNEDEQQIFLNDIEEFTTWHIRILQCLLDNEAERRYMAEKVDNPNVSAASKREQRLLGTFPELAGRTAFYDTIIRDLHNRGLYPFEGVRGTLMAQPSPTNQTEKRANEFLAFISNPV